MESGILKFKTDIKCESCVASVKPYLDKAVGSCLWDVDILDKDKILTVTSKNLTEQEIIEIVKKAGFRIELVNL